MAVAALLLAAVIAAAGGADLEVQIGPDGSAASWGARSLVRRASGSGRGRLVPSGAAAPAQAAQEGPPGEGGPVEADLLQGGGAAGAESAAASSVGGALFAAVGASSGAESSGGEFLEARAVQHAGSLTLPVSTDCRIDLVKSFQVLDSNNNGMVSFDELKRVLRYFDPRSDWDWRTKAAVELDRVAFSSLVQEFMTKPPPGVCDKALVDRGCGVLNLRSTERYGSPADDDPTVVHAKEIGELLSTPAAIVESLLQSLGLAHQEGNASAPTGSAYAVSCMELCTKAYASLAQTTRDKLKASNRVCSADNGTLACDTDVSREQLYLQQQCSQRNLPAGFETPPTLLESEHLIEEPRAFQGYNRSALLVSVLNMFNVYPPTAAVTSSLANLLTLSDGTLLAYGNEWGHGSTIALLGGHSKKWCADEGSMIKCNRDTVGTSERFRLEDAGDGKWALRGGKDGKYCADEGDSGIKCNRNAIGGWEKFTIGTIPGQNTALTFRGGQANLFCADEKGSGMKCNHGAVGAWERFDVLEVHGSSDFHNLVQRRIATAQSWVTKVLQSMGGGGAGNHVTTWFGNNNADARSKVQENVNNVNSDMMDIYPSFPRNCGADVAAYVSRGPRHEGGQLMVYFCDHFRKFDANIQARTVIHEVVRLPPSNADGATYGWDNCKKLARQNSADALRNAGNFENFCQDLVVGTPHVHAPAPTPPTPGGACFPRDAKVQLKGGASRELDELKVGDLIAVADPGSGEVRYEPLLGDFHSDLEHQRQIEYVTLVHELGTVSASATHYVYTLERGFSPAGDLRVGDTLSIWRGTSDGVQRSRVVASFRQTKLGMYAPFTFGGTLFVDGVLASSYTADEFHAFLSPRAQEGLLALVGGHDGVHRLMHALSLPLRLVHYMGFPALAKWGADRAVPGASAVGRIFSADERRGTDDMPLYVNWVGRAVGSVLEMVV